MAIHHWRADKLHLFESSAYLCLRHKNPFCTSASLCESSFWLTAIGNWRDTGFFAAWCLCENEP